MTTSSLLAHGSGDVHDLWLTALPLAASAVTYLVLRARTPQAPATSDSEATPR